MDCCEGVSVIKLSCDGGDGYDGYDTSMKCVLILFILFSSIFNFAS
jgi:hypothetical protein